MNSYNMELGTITWCSVWKLELLDVSKQQHKAAARKKN
jgi:hypothetical protein